MQTFPSVLQKFFDKVGNIADPYYKYFTQFTIAPPAFMDVALDSSPFEYDAKEPGHLYIAAGTISAISLTRGTDTLALTIVKPLLVPVAVNDVVTITYTVLPTVKFIPSYGYNTTAA